MTVDVTQLFEPRPDRRRFADLRDEVEAVATGREQLMVKLFPRASVETDSLFGELRQVATELGLSMVVQDKADHGRASGVPLTYVFVVTGGVLANPRL